jgi:AraC family transcriptional regulator
MEEVILENGMYGERLGRSFRVAAPPTLTCQTHGGHTLALTELRCDRSDFGLSEPMPLNDAYLIVVNAIPVKRQELWLGGQLVNSGPSRAGDMSFYDLRISPVAYLGDPFRLLAFYVPIAAITEIGIELGGKSTTDFVYDPHCYLADPVVANLGQSLEPFLAAATVPNQLYVDHILLAMRSHLAVAYGGLRVPSSLNRGGLAPWQRRRAHDLLHSHLIEGISIERLADSCSLSTSAFLRAFRKSTGLPPHQWLLARRVERASQLMSQGELALAEIALSTGFSDQSHFTRVFSQRMGVSPGVWRRAQSAQPQ